MDFNATLNECVKSLPFIDRLKDQQRLAIVSLLQGNDVVCILPTSFGKSLIFQLYILTTEIKDRRGSTMCFDYFSIEKRCGRPSY